MKKQISVRLAIASILIVALLTGVTVATIMWSHPIATSLSVVGDFSLNVWLDGVQAVSIDFGDWTEGTPEQRVFYDSYDDVDAFFINMSDGCTRDVVYVGYTLEGDIPVSRKRGRLSLA